MPMSVIVCTDAVNSRGKKLFLISKLDVIGNRDYWLSKLVTNLWPSAISMIEVWGYQK